MRTMATKAEKIEQRIDQARENVADFVALYNKAHLANEDPINDYCLTDILTDLRHYCEGKCWDWDNLIQSADMHYRAEISGEDMDDDETV